MDDAKGQGHVRLGQDRSGQGHTYVSLMRIRVRVGFRVRVRVRVGIRDRMSTLHTHMIITLMRSNQIN